MNLKVSIHQPHYLPWAPYIYKIIRSDVFVFLDDVQFDCSDYQHRNYISKGRNRLLLTIPVRHEHTFVNINESKIVNLYWKKKHLKSIFQFYNQTLSNSLCK
ncbi:WbqC family protein [Lactobacillus kefiranofaciens]|uniref:WbqC family protein n=1 Tax=Lactobacillus kefiranofaciens TaxID=267818 RepID=UPI003CC81AA2